MEVPTNKVARLAGLLYLVVVATGMFNLLYIPSRIPFYGDPGVMLDAIREYELLYRTGIVAGIVCYTAFLVLPFALYKLLHHVGREAAVLMVAFAVASVPISFVGVLDKFDVLSLIGGAERLQAFTPQQLQAQAVHLIDAAAHVDLVSEVFWGLWLLPFGYLVFKSGFLPRVLGILLMLGCFGSLTEFFGRVLFSGYSETVSSIIGLPASLGEIGICLWLLFVGVGQRSTGPSP